MGILEATRRFEEWLGKRTPLVKSDLAFKHKQMRSDPFLFFRATYYRWAQLWLEYCPKLARVATVLAVGDLHLENFGTWRDEEGRLIWGVNDFDEAHPMAFTNDLVRLAVSALLAGEASSHFKLPSSEVCALLWEGYCESIEREGDPFVLMELHPKLRAMAIQELRQPAHFWERVHTRTVPLKEKLPDDVRKVFCKSLPDGVEPEYRLLREPKGLGCLGRERYLALATWQGGLVLREAKPVLPSALLWAANEKAGEGNPWLEKTVDAAVRCADPFYRVRRGWLVRRLSPDCSRIDFDQLEHHSDIASLLRCMGEETANIHLGTARGRRAIRAGWRHLPKDWLESAAHKMLHLSLQDWHDFRKKA